jgi:GNAT superfamily N-acetyltransferase
MQNSITYREMAQGNERAVSALIEEVFDEFIAPDYGPGGSEEFKKHIVPEDLLQRHLNGDSFIIVAENNGEFAGVIDVRDGSHVRLFFVRKEHHGQGTGRELFSLALARCLRDEPSLEDVTVNSSPYAVHIYENLGFEIAGPEQTRNGMRYTPMTYRIYRR